MLSSSEITKSVLNELTARGCEVWRQNQVKVPGRAFTGKKGLSDICGFHKRTGIALYCEIKSIGDRLNDDQIKFLTTATEANCIALIASEANGKIIITTFRDYITGLLTEANLSELLNLKRKIA
jgi:hypothetical protein